MFNLQFTFRYSIDIKFINTVRVMQLVSPILKETINEKIVFSCNLCEDNMRNQIDEIVQSQKLISVFDQHRSAIESATE